MKYGMGGGLARYFFSLSLSYIYRFLIPTGTVD